MSFMALIGMIGLSGIVVNDSIIMVSFINSVRDSAGDDHGGLIEAIVCGARERLRPIIITTVTTVGALLPTVYGIGGSAASIVPRLWRCRTGCFLPPQ